MGLLDLLFGRKPAPAKKSRIFLTSQGSTSFEPSDQAPQSQSRIRKDLLRLVLRDVLARTGIPGEWLTAEMVSSASPRRGDGIHVRFLVRHWSPRLLEHGPAFQEEFTFRLLMLDPRAQEWLHGFSWQFSLPDSQVCPRLPAPASWRADAAAPATPAVTHATPPRKLRPIDVVGKPAESPPAEVKVLDKFSQRVAEQGADLKRRRQGIERYEAQRSAPRQAAK
jgi:hypothetical protein